MSANAADAFTNIYSEGIWYAGSGSGSTPENTQGYRSFIEGYMDTHHIASVLDLGCGNWSSSQFIDWGDRTYHGVDVVEDVIAANVDRFASPRVTFGILDFYNQPLPSADLVIIKDVFQHWPNEKVRRFLPKLKQFSHALITNTQTALTLDGTEHSCGPIVNNDIVIGEMRPIDLSIEPFNTPVNEVFRHLSRRANVDEVEIKVTVQLGRTVTA